MKLVYFTAASLVCSLLSPTSTATPLCEADEVSLFSCKAKEKFVSVCASRSLTESAGYVRYLYGKPGKIELEYPKKHEPARSYFQWSKSWSPGVNVYLKFSIGDFKYYVYAGQGESHSDNADANSIYHWEYSGVAIRRNGKLIRNIKCNDATIAGLDTVKVIELSKIPSDDETGFSLLAILPPP